MLSTAVTEATLTSARRAGRLGSDVDTRGGIRGELRAGVERAGPHGYPGVTATVGGELGGRVGGRAGLGVSSFGYGGPEWGLGFGGYPYGGYDGYDAGFRSPYGGGYYGATPGYGYYGGYGPQSGYYYSPAYTGGYNGGYNWNTARSAPAGAVPSVRVSGSS